MGEKPIITVDDLVKHYHQGSSRVKALDSVSFQVTKGESLAILGPSGSGKTTLLEIIGGLNKPTSGSVRIDGQNPFSGSDKEISKFRNETIGFIFQSMHLQEYFSALENVMLPMLVCGADRSVAADKARELLTQVGLGDRIDHRPSKLSGGQQQRVAIARSLAQDPKIIMADEPTSKLDKENEEIILNIFKTISKSGVSVLIITHDERVSKQFDRELRLMHGKITQ